jgi:uncharacterized protein (TIGR02246 family)
MLRRTDTLVVMLSVVALGTLHAQVKQQGNATAAARTAIDALWSSSILAARQGDADALAAMYAPDAMIVDPTMATLSGRANIQNLFRGMLATMKFIGETHQTTSFDVSGDLAVETGTYVQTIQERGKAPATSSSRYTLVFKNLNGQWFILRDVATPMPPAGKP